MNRLKRKQNPELISLIHELKKLSIEKDISIWKDIALRLEKPLNNWPVVNLEKISKYTKKNEIALIPGKVLSDGELNNKITIAAWSFSEKAINKIKNAGGTNITIFELIKKHPDGKNIRILG